MHIISDASKAIERYGSEAPFIMCELIAVSLMYDEAELANDFRRVLVEIERRLGVICVWQ